MFEEIWKPVEGYEGLYEVSNLGRVKSLRNGIMKPSLSNKGYELISISKNNIRKTLTIHRLVAKTFCFNPDNKSEVDHINGIRTDNRAENLRWVSSSENHLNPITREKSSKVREGHTLSEESKRKLSEANKGKHLSDETKRKISESLKRRNKEKVV